MCSYPYCSTEMVLLGNGVSEVKQGFETLGLVALLLVALAVGLSLLTPQGSATHASRLVRLNQLDQQQYRDSQEYSIWAYSTCSTTAMTEVMNAYGRALRITDVLQAERDVHAITPELGLLQESGIARTVARFGFQARIDHVHTLAQVVGLANQGTPVIVGIPPGRSAQFSRGHLLIVSGGDEKEVHLVDSSSYNLTVLSRERFGFLWGGMTAIVTPQARLQMQWEGQQA